MSHVGVAGYKNKFDYNVHKLLVSYRIMVGFFFFSEVNAQLPQIINENVFPNDCSFLGLCCFPGMWLVVAAALFKQDTHSPSGNECDLHSGCLCVQQKLNNFIHRFVLLPM